MYHPEVLLMYLADDIRVDMFLFRGIKAYWEMIPGVEHVSAAAVFCMLWKTDSRIQSFIVGICLAIP